MFGYISISKQVLVQCFTVLVHEREEITQERAALHIRMAGIGLALIARLPLPFSLDSSSVAALDGSAHLADLGASVRQVQLAKCLLSC